MTRVLLAAYTGLGVVMVIGMSAFTISEVYVSFREGATGFWSTLFAWRGGIVWAGWALVPYGILSTLYMRSPRIWKSKSYDLQYAVFATGSIVTGAIGFLFLNYDWLPFTRSQPKLFFSALPVPQLFVCSITYTFWRLYGGTLGKRHLTTRSTRTRDKASRAG